MEAIGGRLALVEVVDSAALDETNGSSACAADGVSDGVIPQSVDDSPDSNLVLPEMVFQGVEEQGKVDEVGASYKSLELTEVDLLARSVGEVPVELAGCEVERFGSYSPRGVSLPASALALDSTFTPFVALEHVSPVMQGPSMKDLGAEMSLALEELESSDTLSPEEKIAKVLAQYEAIEPQEKTLPSSMMELCREITDMPKAKQLRMDVPSLTERRSIRLDKKNKQCVIPVANRAEFRLAESFGELPKGQVLKKGSEEDVQDKMKPYLRLCKQPASPTALQAIREMVQVNG